MVVEPELFSTAARVGITASGMFLMTGLLTGVWKYRQMAQSADAQAHPYVDICHRAALMYSFAAMILAVFAELSAWSDSVNLWACLIPLGFFASAILTYAIHGALQDTDNQLRQPHRLGRGEVSGRLVHGFMWALIAGEIGGVAVLLAGVIVALF